MGTLFESSRPDGRADRHVVYDLIKDAEPDSVFGYDQFIDALQDGVDVEITHDRAGRAARAASDLMLTLDQRALECIRGVGYRVARADDHAILAQQHHHKARRESQRSLALLTNVRESELSPDFRGVIRDMLVAFRAVAQMMHAAEQRTKRVETVLDEVVRVNQDLAARVARLEQQDGAV